MTFTPEQIEALDSLEGEFGPVDPYLHNVTSREHIEGSYGYEHWINRNLTEALRYWGQYKYALSVDWDEKERIEREKREKAYAARAEGVRESLVIGFLTGLLPKTQRAFADGYSDLSLKGSRFSLFAESGDSQRYVSLAYNRETFMLTTATTDDKMSTEDLTLLNGNTSPRQQVKGLEAVHAYLDGQS